MPASRSAATTVVEPVGSQTASNVFARAAQGLRRVFFTAEQLTDPNTLYRVIYQLQQNLASTLSALGARPDVGATFLQGVVFTAGQTQTLQHRLGRPYKGWIVTRAQTHAASFIEAALPTGVTSDQSIALTSANAGTYDIEIF